MAVSTFLLVTTLNVNGLNAPIKRYSMGDWIKKKKSHPYAAFMRLTSELKAHTD